MPAPETLTALPQDTNCKTLGHVYVPPLSTVMSLKLNISSAPLQQSHGRSLVYPHSSQIATRLQVDTLIANATIEEQVSH